MKCEFCGAKENLIKHHIVPNCFGIKVKDNLAILCLSCHGEYERELEKLKGTLSSQFEVKNGAAYYFNGRRSRYIEKLHFNLLTLERYGSKMPPKRKRGLISRIATWAALEGISGEELALDKFSRMRYGEFLKKELGEEKLIEIFRKHFNDHKNVHCFLSNYCADLF